MKKKYYAWMSVGILLIAANLRLPITMIPPILPWLHTAVGLPNSLSGVLTTIPLLMFAILSPIIARCGTKIGNVRVLFVTLFVLSIGCYLRAIPSTWFLIIGTILAGVGISGGNVLLPAVIQEYFPVKSTLLTSLYTFTMGFVASFGTGLAAPLTKATNLQTTIISISTISLISFLVWTYVYRGIPKEQVNQEIHGEHLSPISKYSLTWLITFYFGAQSLLYYSLLTVLPSFWSSNGMTTDQSSLLATLFQLCGMVMSLLTPIIASTKKGMYVVASIVGLTYSVGSFLLPLVKHSFLLNIIIVILMSMGTASAFSLCIVFFQRKTAHIRQTAQLSGIAQSAGYLFAAVGPTLSVFLHEKIHNWTPIFVAYGLLGMLLFAAGLTITKKDKIN